MRFRDRLALNVAPLFIRLALAITFLWAGVGKIAGTFEPTDAQRATLQKLGMIAPPPAPPTAPTPPPEGTPPEPERPPGAGDAGASPAPAPGETVRNWNGIALLLHAAANPGLDENGAPLMPLWPQALAQKPWISVSVFLLVSTELLGGLFALFGFLTRLTGLALATAMLSAAWLTEIGPFIQNGTAVLGFLPPHDPWDPAAWETLLWQLILAGSALSLLFSGAGAASIDHVLWGGRSGGRNPRKAEHSRKHDEEEDDEDE